MFGIVNTLRSKMHIPTVEEREMAYLNGSRDRYELEYRQRQVDRGLFRNRGNNAWL